MTENNKEKMKEMIKEMIYDSAVIAKYYKFKNEMPKITSKVAMSKWISKEINEIDSCIDNLEEKHGFKSVCKKGCAECCKQCIVVFSSECTGIEIYINNMDDKMKNTIKIKTQELCDVLEEKRITNARLNSYMSENERRRLQEEYFSLEKPCVFLDENNECLIHPVRPSLCWSYREYLDSENCKFSCFSETAIKYNDWEKRANERLINARKTHLKLMILPFAIREMMHW